MKATGKSRILAIVLLSLLAIAMACSKVPNDAQIQSEIQNKFSQDSGLQEKQVGVQASQGVVTLSGTVDNDAERQAASRLAANSAGVKQVLNNLQIAVPAAAPEPVAEVAPPVQESKPAAKPRSSHPRTQHPTAKKDYEPVAAPAPSQTANLSSTPAPAPAVPATPPPPQKVTIPSGSTLAVRLSDTIDSERAQQGQTFHATLDSPLSYEGDVVIPAGYDVEGHVVNVQSAGKFAGQSLLVLQLDRIAVGNKYYNLQTDQYSRKGASRGKNTAEKVGAGAGIGAIIGAIAGGGKGAAIGAAAGGGLGGGVQAATKGQQIKLPTETVLNFTLQAPLTVLPTTQGPNGNRPRLEANQQ